jgi:hypothetical protein
MLIMISVYGSLCHIFNKKQKAFKDTLEDDKDISENLQPILQLSHQWWTVRDDQWFSNKAEWRNGPGAISVTKKCVQKFTTKI